MENLKIILSETISHRYQMFSMKHCLVDIYKNCSNHSPLVKIGPAPEILRFFLCFIQYIVKMFKRFLGMKHCLVDLYQNYSNYGRMVNIGPTLETTTSSAYIFVQHPQTSCRSLHYYHIRQDPWVTLFYLDLYRKTISPRAQMFAVQHPQVDLYQNFSNYAPRVNIGLALVLLDYIDL